MTQHPATFPALIAAATGAVYAWDLIALAVIAIAVVRVIAVPAARWPHGRWSQLAWIAAAIWADGRLGAWYVPAGALFAIWRTHRLARPKPPDPAPLPLAEASPRPEEDTHDRHQH